MFVAATGAYKSYPDFFTFPIYILTKDLTKNFEKKFGGSSRFSPSKKVAQKNDPTMGAYDPHFLSQNLWNSNLADPVLDRVKRQINESEQIFSIFSPSYV